MQICLVIRRQFPNFLNLAFLFMQGTHHLFMYFRQECFRELFKHLRILPLQSQYILVISLSLFVVDNKNFFHVKSEIHSINTRQNSNIHQPQANLTLYQKGAYYCGIKVFNNLPPPQHKKFIL